MIADPKLLVAGLCIVIASFFFALMAKQVRARRLRAVLAPRPQALSAARPMADYGDNKPWAGRPGVKTISIIHDFGHPYGHTTEEREYLSAREAFEVLAEIRSVDKNAPIDIILHTPGGSAFACELIAAALKDRPNTAAYVPYCAMSAGTIIALATEKVVMGRYACLGPIDTQYGWFPAESFKRLIKDKPIQNIEDTSVLMSYLAEKDLRNAKARACDLLNKKHFGNDDACALTDFLVSGDLPHSEQISRARAAELGVNLAAEECPDPVYSMVETRLQLLRTMNGQGAGFDPHRKLEKPK